ncbi:hypothetical protein J8273_3956 [Carpediemonas membranifera]|uniref:Uncharacterized protein n=1 Tax=Carpediemonas membranifera TaxID=201153 RepID=A0A8J6B7G0_9EUKA|nr:hypothetical protein J8273_3956 [Carpediemonas membranifera]|eukprot:KAG9394322.1 hypothetical protein J8273_3956 [Carpediemonas membranifera]
MYEVPSVGLFRVGENIEKNIPLIKDISIANNERELDATSATLVTEHSSKIIADFDTAELDILLTNAAFLTDRAQDVELRLRS